MDLNLNQVKQQYGVFNFKFIRISQITLPISVQNNLNTQLKKL